MPLPKLVVIIPDEDLLKLFGDTSQSISKAFSWILNFVMTEYERCVSTFKENLPAKCIKNQGFPYFLWIQPRHKNFASNSHRFKFNQCIEETLRLHSNVHTLALKKGWDDKDDNLYLQDMQRFTNEGFRTY